MIYLGVGHDQTQTVSHGQHAAHSANDLSRLGQDRFDQARIFAGDIRQLPGLCRRADTLEVDIATLGLGYHLLGDDDHRVRVQLDGVAPTAIPDDLRQIVPGIDLGYVRRGTKNQGRLHRSTQGRQVEMTRDADAGAVDFVGLVHENQNGGQGLGRCRVGQ
ncbi:hypothetical protein D3C85_1431930 [compost metagenome]